MKKKGTWSHIILFLKPYIFLIMISILISIISVVLTLYIPIKIGNVIDLIIDTGKVEFSLIIPILIRILIIVIIIAGLQWLMNSINNRIVFDVVSDIRDEAFKKIQVLPLAYIDSHPYGDIVSRVIADADQFSDGLLLGFSQLFTGIITIIGTLIFMLTINIRITLIVVLLTPISFVVAKLITKYTNSMYKMQSETRGEQTAFIDEMISGQKTVKALRHEKINIREFDEINDRLGKYSLKAIFYSSLTNPCTRFINNIIYACVGLTGALIALHGGITVGMLSSFLSYSNQYSKPFNEISGVVTEFQNALACATRLFELIDETPQIPEIEGVKELNDIKGNVSFDNVEFSYTNDKKLIENFNINVVAGQHIAIVGPTGCGKTTMINLLMRFYDVKEGSIKVEDNDVKSITRSSLRKNYGMVLQDTWLKSGTVKENIIMGKPEATEEEVIRAAKAAHAHGFINQLPKGYDTDIGENGDILSQGQKQLLCIARTMLCLPPMLILDEATSSIDTRTELHIQKAFSKMMEGRTTFIVAHRLSTIRDSDLILVMKEGNIIEQGDHDSLLAEEGFYSQLWNSQFLGTES